MLILELTLNLQQNTKHSHLPFKHAVNEIGSYQLTLLLHFSSLGEWVEYLSHKVLTYTVKFS